MKHLVSSPRISNIVVYQVFLTVNYLNVYSSGHGGPRTVHTYFIIVGGGWVGLIFSVLCFLLETVRKFLTFSC